MRPRRLGVAAVAAGLLALAGAGGRAAPVASAELHHAAVVIDTGDGKVREFCLAFPEESISGAEALRRIDADAVFASYGAKGQAVCSLCGTGCPAGDCFCDASKYWAYHRAGPGGAPYELSSAGASGTEVRDGDVEGWRWGTGAPPPPATVGEVCDVPEPAARTASSTPAASTTTSEPARPPGAGSAAEPPASGDEPPAPAPAPAGAASAPIAPPSTVAPPPIGEPGPAGPGPDELAPETPADGVEEATVVPVDTTVEPPEKEAASRPLATDRRGSMRAAEEGGIGGALGLVAFLVLLSGLLLWRARLRRANVRS